MTALSVAPADPCNLWFDRYRFPPRPLRRHGERKTMKHVLLAQGAVTVDGKMVDYANIRMIWRLMSFKGRD
jgi:hypothetical protein